MRNYSPLPNNPTLSDVIIKLNDILQTRDDDVREFNNLKNAYLTGRTRSDRTIAPTSHTDVASVDKAGDEFFVGGYIYRVVLDGTALKWARIIADITW